jgi:hypothetical protein
MVIFMIPAAMAVWMVRVSPRWWRAAPIHLVAVVLYSVLHVSGFVALRKLAYLAFMGEPYQFGPLSTEFPYEFRKDLLAYGLASIIFYLSLRRSARESAAHAHTGSVVASFDIRDGARLVRVPVPRSGRALGRQLRRVSAGRRAAAADALVAQRSGEPDGRAWLRAHPSLLAGQSEPGHRLRPEGSGDYAVELGAVEAPLSRRFPRPGGPARLVQQHPHDDVVLDRPSGSRPRPIIRLRS